MSKPVIGEIMTRHGEEYKVLGRIEEARYYHWAWVENVETGERRSIHCGVEWDTKHEGEFGSSENRDE